MPDEQGEILPFSKKLSVGNRILDSEHAKLHSLLKEVDRAIAARDFAALTEMVELLEENLCGYFSVEEKIAQALDFDFSQHRLAHQNLLREFQRMKDELTVQSDAVSKPGENSCIKNLMNHLILHVQEDSKPLKILLDTNFYDFKPN